MEASGPLIEAARKGDADEVARILDDDASLVNAKAAGVSALLLALYSGHPEVSRIFVERGGPRRADGRRQDRAGHRTRPGQDGSGGAARLVLTSLR